MRNESASLSSPSETKALRFIRPMSTIGGLFRRKTVQWTPRTGFNQKPLANPRKDTSCFNCTDQDCEWTNPNALIIAPLSYRRTASFCQLCPIELAIRGSQSLMKECHHRCWSNQLDFEKHNLGSTACYFVYAVQPRRVVSRHRGENVSSSKHDISAQLVWPSRNSADSVLSAL